MTELRRPIFSGASFWLSHALQQYRDHQFSYCARSKSSLITSKLIRMGFPRDYLREFSPTRKGWRIHRGDREPAQYVYQSGTLRIRVKYDSVLTHCWIGSALDTGQLVAITYTLPMMIRHVERYAKEVWS